MYTFEHVPYPTEEQKLIASNGTVWSNVPPQTTSHTVFRPWRAVYGQAGVRNSLPEVASANTADEIFKLMFDDEIIGTIVHWTNVKAEAEITEWNSTHPADQQKHPWLPLDNIQMRAHIGILIHMGAEYHSKKPVCMMWRSHPKHTDHPVVATMGRDRFLQITRYLRFDELSTREARKANDTIAAISDVYNSVVENFKKIYTPRKELTVDETLVGFRGRFRHRVYIKSKPKRYGIKLWTLADSHSRYAINMMVICHIFTALKLG